MSVCVYVCMEAGGLVCVCDSEGGCGADVHLKLLELTALLLCCYGHAVEGIVAILVEAVGTN